MSVLVMVAMGAVALLSIRMLVESKTSAAKVRVESKLEEAKNKRALLRQTPPSTAQLVQDMNSQGGWFRQLWDVAPTTGEFGRPAMLMKRAGSATQGGVIYRLPAV